MRPSSLPENSANAIASFSSHNAQAPRQRRARETVHTLPGGLRGKAFATYMEQRLPHSSELYLAARLLATDAMQADLLMHSRSLRGYLGISNRLRNHFLPSMSTIPSDQAVETLAWAAPRLSSPYQERAITDIDTALQGVATRVQRIALLIELGHYFDTFSPASQPRIARQLLTPSRIRTMPDAVMAPFRLSLEGRSGTSPQQATGLAGPSHRQQLPARRATGVPHAVPIDVNTRDAAGLTQAERTIRQNPPDAAAVVARLRAAGADLVLPDEEGNTLLHRTVMAGNRAGVNLLLKNGVNVHSLNRGTSPAIARYAANPAAVATAMTRPNWIWEQKDQATPLHLAAAFSAHPAMIGMLAECGAAIDAEDMRQITPLHSATMSQHPANGMALIAAGANVNKRMTDQRTPLHLATLFSRQPELLLALLEHGATHFNLPAVAQAMRYVQYAMITEADIENAKDRVATREGRDEYVQFIATWKPWLESLERSHPDVFNELRRQVETEREPLSVQPEFTSENDYMDMCNALDRMQTARHAIAVNRLTRELVIQYRARQDA